MATSDVLMPFFHVNHLDFQNCPCAPGNPTLYVDMFTLTIHHSSTLIKV